ncbi:hypothetical protein EBZ80_15695 [bacterium]|nr:hypothetical protein [bacterium]
MTASNIADLKLSSSLNITLPDTFAKAAGQSNSLRLASTMTGKKSSEACRTIQNVAQMFDTLGSISGMFCHLEAESAQFKFGTKYKVVLQMGAQSEEMPLWIDNSTAGQLTMYTCSAGKIREKIILNSSNSNGAKGSILFKGSDNGNSYASALDFDFTTEGVKILKGQNLFSDGTNSFAQDNALEFRDSGVSLMKTASKGQMDANNTFQDRGVVKHNGTTGQALFKGQGTQTGVGSYNFSMRSTFDKDGITVANSTAGSDITVAASELPAFLADGFSISDAAGWDCTTDETVTIDMVSGATAAAHAACEREHPEFSSCWGSDFEQGEQEQID